MSRNYKMDNQNGIYFLTMTTVEWVDVFTRVKYKELLLDSLRYCIKFKGLIVHAYVIMTNHIHIIISRTENGNKFSDIIRDFKKFTSSALIKNIKNNPSESRKAWLLDIFQKNGLRNSNNKYYQLWQQHNHPIILYSKGVIKKKINYIHNNPVKQGIVFDEVDYFYSSAGAYMGHNMESKLPIKLLDVYFSF
jgi:putative transposase